MRRLLAAAVLAGSSAAGTAAAEPHCATVSYDTSYVGVCYEYVCVDICAPEVHVDPRCNVDTDPRSVLVEAACRAVDAL